MIKITEDPNVVIVELRETEKHKGVTDYFELVKDEKNVSFYPGNIEKVLEIIKTQPVYLVNISQELDLSSEIGSNKKMITKYDDMLKYLLEQIEENFVDDFLTAVEIYPDAEQPESEWVLPSISFLVSGKRSTPENIAKIISKFDYIYSCFY